MKILFCSVPFRPSVGGIETVSALLAERFAGAGHEVTLVTRTAGRGADAGADDGAGDDAYRIVRQPGLLRLASLVAWADVVFHNNISLRFAWPQLIVRRPWVVAHHTWIPQRELAATLKRRVLRHARQIAVSQAVAQSLPGPCTVVPNPYADDVFRPAPEDAAAPRETELVFVGRLVSDKGVDVLLDALALLARRGRSLRLSVVGDGPEAPALAARARRLGIEGQVSFLGRRGSHELALLLRRHQVLVVPSTWEEPFGVVALEAIACGCVPLVARSGGLPEAVGRCGRVVARGDPLALARGIESLLDQPGVLAGHRAEAAAHLERHGRDRVARDYLQVIEDAHRTHAAQGTPRAA